MPRLDRRSISTSPRFGAVTVLVLLLALVMGLAPARGPVGDLGITCDRGGGSPGGRNHATRAALVVGEVALAVMLLVSAASLREVSCDFSQSTPASIQRTCSRCR